MSEEGRVFGVCVSVTAACGVLCHVTLNFDVIEVFQVSTTFILKPVFVSCVIMMFNSDSESDHDPQFMEEVTAPPPPPPPPPPLTSPSDTPIYPPDHIPKLTGLKNQ